MNEHADMIRERLKNARQLQHQEEVNSLASKGVPDDFLSQMADLTTHHINGVARMGNIPFACPLITQVEGNLWQGGVPPIEVPPYFQFVLSLYPWEKYKVPETTTIRREFLYDSDEVPFIVPELARWVNEKRKIGPTLVHCQAGLNRSALVVAVALVLEGMSPTEAIMLLRERRSPAVLCNQTFETYVKNFKVKK